MSNYLLHGKLAAKEGKAEELTTILLEAAKAVSTVKGCISYLISKDNKEQNVIWITEVWESKQDHDDSLKLDEVKKIIFKAIPIIDGQPQKGQELEILGGKGI